MSGEMRNLKYETLIREVNNYLKYKQRIAKSGMPSIYGIGSVSEGFQRSIFSVFNPVENHNTTLALIFDYDKLNIYGKTIIDLSRPLLLKFRSKGENTSWSREYSDISQFKSNRYKIEAAKDFLTYCNEEGNREETYKFIFWAMMVLTVDKTNSEEHLSLICDFARMFKITDDEIEDILKVIKVIYHEEKSDVKLKTETVQNIFSGVLALHNN